MARSELSVGHRAAFDMAWPGHVPATETLRPPVDAARQEVRVGYVLDGFPQASERFVLEEILELRRCGVDVHVMTVERLGDGIDASRRRTIQRQAQWVARHVSSERIAHVHAQFGTADLARTVKKLTGVGYSFAAAASDVHHDGEQSGSLRDRIRDADFVVVPSEISRNQVLLAAGASAALARNVHRLYRGVDLERYAFHSDSGREPNSILTVAPLVEGSGTIDLIDAVHLLRERHFDVRLTIVGEGELENEVRDRITALRLDDHVSLLKPSAGTRIISRMRLHAVMALPYRVLPGGGQDGVPPVFLQAMAVGLPIVSTTVTGVSEVIEDGWTGRLVTPGDPRWLSGAIETMLQYSGHRRRIAKDAREAVERYFGLFTNVSRLARLFESAAGTQNVQP